MQRRFVAYRGDDVRAERLAGLVPAGLLIFFRHRSLEKNADFLRIFKGKSRFIK
jgi:hypothetical protein